MQNYYCAYKLIYLHYNMVTNLYIIFLKNKKINNKKNKGMKFIIND